RLSGASDRRQTDHRHRLRGARGREQCFGEEKRLRESAGAAKSGARPGAGRQELVQQRQLDQRGAAGLCAQPSQGDRRESRAQVSFITGRSSRQPSEAAGDVSGSQQPASKSSISPSTWNLIGKSRFFSETPPLIVPSSMELTGLFSKLPPLPTLTPTRSTTAALRRA